MEKLTRKLIKAISRDVQDISLVVCDVPFDYDDKDEEHRKYVPGVSYRGIDCSGCDIDGRIVCKQRFFDSDPYFEARIVASEAGTYLESLGAKVIISHLK